MTVIEERMFSSAIAYFRANTNRKKFIEITTLDNPEEKEYQKLINIDNIVSITSEDNPVLQTKIEMVGGVIEFATQPYCEIEKMLGYDEKA